nr:hypothetical protein [uncultured Cupriavidus sp.]
MTLRFHDLSRQEQDEVATACGKHGFVPDDFEFVIEVERGGEGRKSIAVERLVGGQFQKYQAANGVAWMVPFEADLAADWFGFPLAD